MNQITPDKKGFVAKYEDGKPASPERVIEHQDYYILPNGIECFDVIRYFPTDIGMAIKYLWRNGRKKEIGIELKLKQIEDLEKSIICIKDHIKMLKENV